MKLDPNDFQCVKKLTAKPEEDGGLSTGVIGKYDDFLTLNALAGEMVWRLGDTINTLLEMPKVPSEIWDKLQQVQDETDAATGADVALEVNAHKMWEDKIAVLEKELTVAEETLAPNRQYLAAELAAKKLSFTKMQIALKKKDIESQETIALVEKDKIAAQIWAQNMYKPLSSISPSSLESTQAVTAKFYDTKLIETLKKQTPFGSSKKYTSGSTTLQVNKSVVDDSWDDETENTQLKFLQKIGIMSNANVSPQSRVMRSQGYKTVHRLLCDRCKEAIPAEDAWINGFKSDQPEIVEFCKAHRHVTTKTGEGRKFRG